MSNNCEYQRADYQYQSRKWRVVRDLEVGDIALKDNDLAALGVGANTLVNPVYGISGCGSSYLRQINPADIEAKNIHRNETYIKCAVLVNFTKNTRKGMSGMIFRVRPVVELPDDINYLVDDVDGSGLQLWQQMKSTGNNVIGVGRHGLYTDFPTTKESTTVKDSEDGARAYITAYHAEQIINWKVEKQGAKEVLTLVVLVEFEDTGDDEFKPKTTKLIRILRIKDGLYEVETRKVNAEKGVEESQLFFPLDGKGERMTAIPFVFVGSENNNSDIDDAPLYDIAKVNIGHYQNSADVEENSFFASQLTVTATGMTQAWVDDVWKGEAQVGARAVLTGPVGSSFGSIQASESNLAKSLQKDKEDQMVKLGAKLVTPDSSNKTATQANIDSADSTSSLATIAANLNDAYVQSIGWVQMFMNSKGDSVVEINTKFGIDNLSGADIHAMMGAVAGQGMSVDSFIWNMKKGHRLPEDRTIEDEKVLIEQDNLGLTNTPDLDQ